eukprot:69025_1
MSLGRMGAKGFDPAKEIAKEYPHKWNSGTLYRDFLRVIQRKYPEPQKTKYTNLLRASFREHGFIDNEERMKLMGTGPTTLGSVAIEEEFYEKGIKHPEHPSRYDLIDVFASNLDCQRIHPLPYLIQRDMWYYFGLGEQQQDIIATKISRMAKKLSDKYTERSYEEREQCRQWIVNRLALFEESFTNSNASTSMSIDTANKIKQIFDYLDADKDGYISYKNMFDLVNRNASNYDSECEEVKALLYSRDNIALSTETWYYMSDILYPLDTYLEEYPENKEKEKQLTDRHLQCSHLNPLYRTKGWNLEQLTDAYVKYNFFDVEHHHVLIQNGQVKCDRMYNLMTELAQNIPSIGLIVQHGLATGQHLYVHILKAEEDPDAVTWEKLEEIHAKMGTMDVIKKAKETEEILPQDVLYYDPELCTQEIPATIPDYSVFWHSVFENQMQDLPDYVIQDYFDTIVKPDIEANNDGMFVEPKNNTERDRIIEEHVYNEMEKYMQSWCWKRYAQLLTNPVYALSTWDEHNMEMNTMS